MFIALNWLWFGYPLIKDFLFVIVSNINYCLNISSPRYYLVNLFTTWFGIKLNINGKKQMQAPNKMLVFSWTLRALPYWLYFHGWRLQLLCSLSEASCKTSVKQVRLIPLRDCLITTPNDLAWLKIAVKYIFCHFPFALAVVSVQLIWNLFQMVQIQLVTVQVSLSSVSDPVHWLW